MPGQYCIGEWVRNKKPYFGEHAYKIHDFDSISDMISLYTGAGIHGLPGENQIIIMQYCDMCNYYEGIGIFTRSWLFILGNLVEMWRDLKAALKNVS